MRPLVERQCKHRKPQHRFCPLPFAEEGESNSELQDRAASCSSMANEEQFDRVWEIIERVRVCMLTTRFAGGLRARPLEARPDRDDGRIWFVTDLHSGKEREIESEDDVGLVFIDAHEKAYLSITARAQVLRDHAKAATIWKSTDNVWWRGPDDPNVCVLRVTPITAELWDGPASKAVAAFEFAKARLTGAKPNLGENLRVDSLRAKNGSALVHPISAHELRAQRPSRHSRARAACHPASGRAS
jgi:general stress protein 26